MNLSKKIAIQILITLVVLFSFGSLGLVFAQTDGEEDQQEEDNEQLYATIKTTVKNPEGEGLKNIVFTCKIIEKSTGSVLESRNNTTGADGAFSWEVPIDDNSEYTCTATSGFPDCYKPATDSDKTFTVDTLTVGEIKNISYVWEFDEDGKVGNKTCKEVYGEEDDPEEEKAPVTEANIPSYFSVSPDLSKITVKEAKALSGLTIIYTGANNSKECDNTGANNSIEWLEEVDLSSENIKNKFNNLNNYLNLGEKGIIEIDISALPELDKRKKMTMNGLNLNLLEDQDPVISVNNEVEDTGVKSINYENYSLSFIAESGGNEYASKPYIEIEKCSEEEINDGVCSFSGKVDNVCSNVSLELSGGKKQEKILEIDQDGNFEGKIEKLKGGEAYKFEVIAMLPNGIESTVEWEVKGKSGLGGILFIFFAGLLIVGGVVAFVYYFKTKKKREEVIKKLKKESESLILDIYSLEESIKSKQKKVDMNDSKVMARIEDLAVMKKNADELSKLIEAPLKDIKPKFIEEKYNLLNEEFETYQKSVLQEAALKELASENIFKKDVGKKEKEEEKK